MERFIESVIKSMQDDLVSSYNPSEWEEPGKKNLKEVMIDIRTPKHTKEINENIKNWIVIKVATKSMQDYLVTGFNSREWEEPGGEKLKEVMTEIRTTKHTK